MFCRQLLNHLIVLSRPIAFIPVLLVALSLGSPATAQAPTEFKLRASDAAAEDRFGSSVAVSGDTAVVGAHLDDDAGADSGSVYVFVRTGTSWIEQAKLTATDGAALDAFGISVGLSGDTAVVGAAFDDDGGSASGSVYVFVRSGTTWTQQAKLTAGDAAALDHFGISVALSGDTVLVGSSRDDDDGFNSGSAYIFVRSGTTWTQQAKLIASDGAQLDQFGISVGLSGDTAVVGAVFDDGEIGSAYVFVRSGPTWSQQAKLTASDGALGDDFGFSVAVSGDTALVGAALDDGASSNSGSAYVFERPAMGWNALPSNPQHENAKLTANDAAASDLFGVSVALSGDLAVIGARLANHGGNNSGSAYVFERPAMGWNALPSNPQHENTKLTASDSATGDFLGWSIAISGGTALVGAIGDDDNGSRSGSAYVYDFVLTETIPPTADAGPDQSIHASQTVNLDGSGSFDDTTATPDLQFAWSFTAKPSGSVATLSSVNTPTPSFVADVPGEFRAELVVTDEAGNPSSPDEVVVSSLNIAPAAAAGDDQIVVVSTAPQLDGTLSSDADGDPLAFAWTLTSQPAGSVAVLSGANSATPALTPDMTGAYTVQLVVNDGFADSLPDTVTLTAVTGVEFAEIQLMDADDLVDNLPSSSFDARGQSSSFDNMFSKAINFLQMSNVDQARQHLEKMISRTDGCALRGAPDPKGKGQPHAADFITDCAAQEQLYQLLTDALGAL